LLGNAEDLLKRARTMTEDITFIGHMKPSYKTILDLTSNEEHIPRIQLYAKVIDNIDDLVERVATILQNPDVVISAVSKTKLLVDTPSDKAQEVMMTLANQEEIHWIERKLSMDLHNHAAGVIMQSDGVNYPESAAIGKKPFWDNGITGEGEIVGIGGNVLIILRSHILDTGIDWDMCFFYDPNNDVPFDTVSDTHRKIRGYKVMRFKDAKTGAIVAGDRKDSINGHGTHTAGSIAGNIMNTSSSYSSLSKYDGVAPGAKIYFTDLSTGEDVCLHF
jgi:hypothetical protein